MEPTLKELINKGYVITESDGDIFSFYGHELKQLLEKCLYERDNNWQTLLEKDGYLKDGEIMGIRIALTKPETGL